MAEGEVGIKAVHHTFRLLRILADADRALSLKDLAEASGWTKSFVQHYLRSLVALRVVDREGERYTLGPFLIGLGAAAVKRYDRLGAVRREVVALRDELGETAGFTVWTEAGPMFVHIEESQRAVNIGARVGSVLPIGESAVGQVYLAFSSVGDDERREGVGKPSPSLAVVRARGYAYTKGGVFPGIGAVAAPVWGSGGKLAGALAVITTTEALDVSPEGRMVTALLERARALSLEGL